MTATAPTTNRSGKRRTRQIIWDAIVDLHAREQAITREVLREITGFTLVVIDDHVKRFIEEDETLNRVAPGVFRVLPDPRAERHIKVTRYPSTGVTIEIGNTAIDLSAREFRALSLLVAGCAHRLAVGDAVGAAQFEDEVGRADRPFPGYTPPS